MALTPRQTTTLSAIKTAAAAHNVNWQVMAALAHHESNLGQSTYGDGGHAIGPFQLNNAGGVLTGLPEKEYQSYADPRKNADFAASSLAKLGITNGSGSVESQIAQGVNRFERPANKQAEIEDATGWYRSALKGSSPVTTPVATRNGPQQLQGMASGLQQGPSNGLDQQRAGLLAYTMNQNAAFAGQQTSSTAPTLQSLLTTAITATQQNKPVTAAKLQTQKGKTIDVHMDPNVVPDHATAGAIKVAQQFLGTPYHFGGANPKSGFDCSGLLQYSYAQMGIKIPRVTGDQIKAGKAVDPANIQPGDAVFFNKGEHVGMYIGNGNFIQAPHTGDVVKISQLQGYDGGTYAIRRYA